MNNLYNAISNFLAGSYWDTVIEYSKYDEYTSANITITLMDIAVMIIGIVLIVSMMKLFGTVIKKVLR